MLDVRDFRLVESVAQHGSLTRASAGLFLTQSALSHQLADLEQRLGTRVFVRAGRRMTLTPAGEKLRAAGAVILGTAARAEMEAREAGRERREKLRISTGCYTCYHWIPAALKRYRAQYPSVEVSIVAEATRRPLPALLRRQLDVAIVSALPRNSRVSAVPLFDDEMVAIVAPDHPWARRRFVTADDVADETFVSYSMSRAESTLYQEVLIPAGVEPKHESQVELTEAIVELVKAGTGFGLLARWAVAPHIAAGTLAAVRMTEAGLSRTWYAAVLNNRRERPHITAFVDLLATSISAPGRSPLAAIA